MTTMATRRICGTTVPAIGLGCMNLSHAYGAPVSDAAGEKLLHEALDLGITLFDTAALYGFGANETLVGRVLKSHRRAIVLCSKGVLGGRAGDDGVLRRFTDGRPEAIVAHCEASLKRLQTDTIDLYYLHRWDRQVPIEDSMGAVARLVEAGKVRFAGLSEVGAATIRRAHAVHPVAAVQSEYSPWTRNPEIAVLEACRELGATFVAFSPVARGFLTSSPPDPAALDAKDIRRTMPRFAPAHFAKNVALHGAFAAIARDAGCTPAQLCLAWLLAKGGHVLPIPGTTSIAHLRENVAAGEIVLPAQIVARVDALMTPAAVSGGRYNAQAQGEVDTEQFAAELATHPEPR
jgi:aryl-alcohol dehydrogenase-like predicted oxidoreductase